MIKTSLPIYLASKSPRRAKLLKLLNLNFKVLSVDVDESIRINELPIKYVKRISAEKLTAAKSKKNDGIFITADTTVVLDNKIIGKPVDKNDAKKILKKLSGNTHSVYTGFAVHNSQTNFTLIDYEKTAVTFRKLSDYEIDDYVAGGSPMDKAGAYGIQDDFGAVFVKKINGCYYNVVGLPLTKLYQNLLKVI
jgi:septum formation protein